MEITCNTCQGLVSLLTLALVLAAAVGRTAAAGPAKYTFYLHNTVYDPAVNNSYFTSVSGPLPPPPGMFPNPFNFGVVSTFEAPLTRGPSNASPVGVGNGFWVMDSQKGYALFYVFTATIADGTYDGTLTIMGQVVESADVRYLTVVGGTGSFLLARGLVTNRLIDIDRTPPARWVFVFECDLFY